MAYSFNFADYWGNYSDPFEEDERLTVNEAKAQKSWYDWIKQLGDSAHYFRCVSSRNAARAAKYKEAYDNLCRTTTGLREDLANVRSHVCSLMCSLRDEVQENNDLNQENEFLRECIKTQAENIAVLQESQCVSEECDERLIDTFVGEDATETVKILADVTALLDKIEAFGSEG